MHIDQDPLEKVMGKRVEEMTADELSSYIKLYLRTMHDIDLPVDGMVERKTLESFIKRYPDGVAGRIVQWVMLHHGGKKDGRYVTASVFCTKMKWWTDMMFLEMQQHAQREAQRPKSEASIFDLADL